MASLRGAWDEKQRGGASAELPARGCRAGTQRRPPVAPPLVPCRLGRVAVVAVCCAAWLSAGGAGGACVSVGRCGAWSSVIAGVRGADGAPRDAAIFIATGALSAYLDNAPTYLVFFNLFGGDAVELMNRYASTLAAISMAAVYCGALTYIGNAPNLMVKAIAEGRGIRMPGFFAYFAWALLLMAVPLGVIVARL